MATESWAKKIVEEVMGKPYLEVGKRFIHPQDGEIEITKGQYWGTEGVSNFWYWKVIATGEEKHGYGANWPPAAEAAEPAQPDPEPMYTLELTQSQATVISQACDADLKNI